jgi:hypothetical protein
MSGPFGCSFFLRFIRVVVSPGGWTSREKWFARLVTFWKCIGIIREYMFLTGIFLYLITNPHNWMGLVCHAMRTVTRHTPRVLHIACLDVRMPSWLPFLTRATHHCRSCLWSTRQ